MCAIAGLLALPPSPPPDPGDPLLQRMLQRLRHRGPDDTGTLFDGPAALGHARLSIIDLAGGHQPMRSACPGSPISVSFNGEIFNYVELRDELRRRGHVLSTRSDTEVLLHLYEDLGPDFVSRLNGQFAFALWDRREGRLLLCRDRVGIRPLFYTVAGGRLLFASEIKALFAAREVERRLDLPALAQTFTLWAPLAPATPFAGIHALPPGHLLLADARTGALTIRRYWDWPFAPKPAPSAPERPRADWEGDLRDLLIDAVRLQLRADVPVGAYLSGGLDSSLLTALIRRHSDAPLRTFSITFADDEDLDERAHQEALVEHLGTAHTALPCRRADIGAAFPKVLWHAEMPLVRTAPVPLYLLSRTVRQAGYKVVLTGEGADEVFGGYDLFKEALARRFCARRPGSALRPRVLERLYPYLKRAPTSLSGYAQAFFLTGDDPGAPCFGHMPRFRATSRVLRLLTKEAQAALAGDPAPDPMAALVGSLPADFSAWPGLCQDQYIEAHTLMTGYLLAAQGDRVAMAHSIEGRFPYLDHRVIELGCALPTWLKVLGLREKHLLRRVAAALVPPSIAARPKQPYRAPESASFFTDAGPLPYVAELLAPAAVKESGLFQPEAVALLLRKCQAGRAIGYADNLAFVGILSVQLLHRMFIQELPCD
jgi:asparagine synthase (glutamine-hydrolysing)